VTEARDPLRVPTRSAARALAPVAGRLGILGGTFDPIHHGHLAIAEAAREELGLERVLFIPAGRPPHRTQAPGASAADRAAMVELAVAGTPAFGLSRIELEREGPSYTVDTLAGLADGGSPSAFGDGAERDGRVPDLWFILSAEAFADLPDWHDPGRILELCRLIVLPREGHPPPDLPDLEDRLPGLAARTVLLDGPHIRISASEVRARAAAGLSVRFLVPDAVAAYIADHRLYRTAGDAADPSAKAVGPRAVDPADARP
jgi:nicotinate-nucleotide adenylyltransferase